MEITCVCQRRLGILKNFICTHIQIFYETSKKSYQNNNPCRWNIVEATYVQV